MNSNKPVQSEETTVNFKPKSTPAPLDRGVMEAYTLAASASPHATVLRPGQYVNEDCHGGGYERKGDNILTFPKGYQKNCWIKISVFPLS